MTVLEKTVCFTELLSGKLVILFAFVLQARNITVCIEFKNSDEEGAKPVKVSQDEFQLQHSMVEQISLDTLW